MKKESDDSGASDRQTAGAAATDRIRAALGKQPFFKGLKAEHLDTLAELATEKSFREGETIFREGDPANRFYIILEGKVELGYESGEQVGVPPTALGPGDDLGWGWMFPPYYFSATAIALEPVRTLFFYGTALRDKCEEDHDLGYEVVKRIAQVAIRHLHAARNTTIKTGAPRAKRR